jgi:hypothetical protein
MRNVDTWAIFFWCPDGRLLFKLLAPTRSTELTVVVSIMLFLMFVLKFGSCCGRC